MGLFHPYNVISPAGAVVVEEVFFAPNKLAGGVDAIKYLLDRSSSLHVDNSPAGVVVAVVAGFRPKRPVVGTIHKRSIIMSKMLDALKRTYMCWHLSYPTKYPCFQRG
jgi:hypothetical protein